MQFWYKGNFLTDCLVPQVVDGFLHILQESQMKTNLYNFGSFFHLHLMTNRLNIEKVFERGNYASGMDYFFHILSVSNKLVES